MIKKECGKKSVMIVGMITMSAILLSGCNLSNNSSVVHEELQLENKSVFITDNEVTEKEEISLEDAEKILEEKYGGEDKDTGNIMSYGYIATVKDKENNKYYAFRHSWLVDGDHMSFLQNVYVSLDGKTIKTKESSDFHEEGDTIEF